MRVRRSIALGVVCFVVSVAAYFLVIVLAGQPSRYVQTVDAKQAEQLKGHAFTIKLTLPDVPSDSLFPVNSPVQMLEDGKAIGPAHTLADFVANAGAGAFIHLQDRLVFSASDSSDPRQNDREYELAFTHGLPLTGIGITSAISIIGFFAGLFLFQSALAGHRKFRAAASTLLCLIGLAGATEALGRTGLAILFDQRGLFLRSVHSQIFNVPDNQAHDIGWNTPSFMPNPYTIYALNPAAHRWREREVDSKYLIRRIEPMRSRRDIRFRVLIVGGSTTHDTQIVDETKTWVYGVEQRFRQRFGSDVDVINAGVGGYTLYENFFHYVSLLAELEPDVVVFYTGINDVHPRLYTDNWPDYRQYNAPSWDAETLTFRRDTSPLRHLALYRLMWMSYKYAAIQQNGIGGVARQTYPSLDDWEKNLSRNPPIVYERGLANFIAMLRGTNRRVAVIPQYFIIRNRADESFKKGVDENNVINAKIASMFSLPYMEQILAANAFRPEDTNDNCHFNEIGADRMAEFVFRFLTENRLAPDAVLPH